MDVEFRWLSVSFVTADNKQNTWTKMQLPGGFSIGFPSTDMLTFLGLRILVFIDRPQKANRNAQHSKAEILFFPHSPSHFPSPSSTSLDTHINYIKFNRTIFICEQHQQLVASAPLRVPDKPIRYMYIHTHYIYSKQTTTTPILVRANAAHSGGIPLIDNCINRALLLCPTWLNVSVHIDRHS